MRQVLPSLVKFYTGRVIPQIGFGTYQLQGEVGINAVKTALKVQGYRFQNLLSGYRHIDTASLYKNGRFVRQAIQSSGIPRDEIFITSKIGPSEQGYTQTFEATQKILKDLGTDYVDLMLIHWPFVEGIPKTSHENATRRLETYKALEELQNEGKIIDIGVSNFLPRHLEHLLKNSSIKPVVNQIEIHPLGWHRPTVDFCRKNNIVVQSYRTLAKSDSRLLQNKLLVYLGKKYSKTSAQIALRWAIQMDFVIMPKSQREKYIKQNFEILDFELTKSEIDKINDLNCNLTVTSWSTEDVIH